MKRIFVLAGIIVLGTALVCGVYLTYLEFVAPASVVAASGQPQPSVTALEPVQIAIYDVDAMAARMPSSKDYYAKLRDEALAVYSHGHPTSTPYDDEAKAAIRLGAYYMTWSDFYGEGVLRDLALFQESAEHKGCSDPMLCDLETNAWDDTHYPNNDARSVQICNEMLTAAQGNSPAAFKLWDTQTAVITTLSYNRRAQTLQLNPPSMQMLPKVISLWEQSLAELIKDKAPDYVIYGMPSKLLAGCQCDEATMNLVIAAIDQAYNETGTDSGLRVALDGDYFIEMAWAARGSGYANTVSDQQSLVFDQRLSQAQGILETAFEKYPHEANISIEMITVCLGKSLGRDTMESWFQRAIKADPNNIYAYSCKAYFLQPRWYGTPDDEVKSVQECVATQNWTFKIPMVLASGLDSVADNGDRDIFAHDEVWKLAESTYRKYLEIYPRSTKYRSYFLRAAFLGNHQDVVREQYKILGKNWDGLILSEEEYKAITTSVGL